MRADPFALLKLLDVQRLDSRLDLLAHQLATLPEHVELRSLGASRAELDARAGELQTQVEDLRREQRKADADVEQVKARRVRDQDRMDRGLVSNPKDLEHLQHELVSLGRRIGELEDAELEVMEKLETTEAELAGLRNELAAVEFRGSELTVARRTKKAEIDTEVEGIHGRRAELVSELPQDLLSLYERLREQKGGVGVAALRARRCSGCSLELNPSDLAEITAKPVDELVRCEECGRILVRASDSGLT